MLRKPNRKIKSRSYQSVVLEYAGLEAKRLLALTPLPPMTTDVAEYVDSVKDAIVRVDDQKRLIVRTTGEENRVNIHLDFDYLQVNRIGYSALALKLDIEQYASIILISGGDDVVRVYGDGLSAQMHPSRLWVSENGGNAVQDALPGFEVFGTNFDHLEVNRSHYYSELGPHIHQSNNRIRMYGTDGIDQLTMESRSRFAIATSAAMSGEGYYYRTNAFGDLYVDAKEGDDMAALAGTRGYDASSLVSGSASGEDFYFARDEYSRITNELWEGRFFNFETQRVDLMGGADQAVVYDADRDATFYRVDGEQLVGAYRRLIGIEDIRIEGADTSADLLRTPDFRNGEIQEFDQRIRIKFSTETSTNEPSGINGGFYEELIPHQFIWTFISFERLRG